MAEGKLMSDLDHVLARIDAELDNSLARLFKLLSIKSISTDPAYADDCRTAAVTVAADLSTLDGQPPVRGADYANGTRPPPPAGPVVVGHVDEAR